MLLVIAIAWIVGLLFAVSLAMAAGKPVPPAGGEDDE